MGVFSDILSALSGRLATMPGLPAVAWKNARFETVPGVEYLSEYILPSDTEQAGLGISGLNEDIGTYQVNVNVPKDIGSARAISLSDSIADHFKRGLVITKNNTSLRITGGSIGVPLSDDIFYMIPVKIRYQTFTQPR